MGLRGLVCKKSMEVIMSLEEEIKELSDKMVRLMSDIIEESPNSGSLDNLINISYETSILLNEKINIAFKKKNQEDE
jgi:translation initiation factor 2B subunit (eIF-2B alpha/beta/delta family)